MDHMPIWYLAFTKEMHAKYDAMEMKVTELRRNSTWYKDPPDDNQPAISNETISGRSHAHVAEHRHMPELSTFQENASHEALGDAEHKEGRNVLDDVRKK